MSVSFEVLYTQGLAKATVLHLTSGEAGRKIALANHTINQDRLLGMIREAAVDNLIEVVDEMKDAADCTLASEAFLRNFLNVRINGDALKVVRAYCATLPEPAPAS